MTIRIVESAASLAARSDAPQGFRPGDVGLLVLRVSWEGEGEIVFPSREELEQALEGKGAVLDDGAEAPAGLAPLHASAGLPQASRAFRVQVLLPPGEHPLPDIPVTLRAAGAPATSGEPATLAGPVVSVATVLGEQDAALLEQAQASPEQMRAEVAQRLAPARGPWELSPIVPWWLIALIALLLAALIAWIVARAWRRRAVAPPAPRPLEPAEVVARRRLRELRDGALLSTGRHLEFHVAVADILKEYLERRLETDLRERTTDEIRRMLHGPLRGSRHVPAIRQDVLAILGACDMVKFARMQPVPSEALSHVDAIERLVTRTTEIATQPAPVAGAPAGGKAA